MNTDLEARKVFHETHESIARALADPLGNADAIATLSELADDVRDLIK